MESIRRDFREVLWVALPKGLAGVLQVGLNLLLLRILGPEQFGIVSVCFAVVILCDSIFGSAIDMSIFRLAPVYREDDPLYSLQIQKAGLMIKPAGALLVTLPIACFASQLSSVLFQRRDEGPLLYLTLAALLGLLLIRSTQVHFQIERRFALYGATDLLNSLLRYGVIGLLLLIGISSPKAILGVYAAAPLGVSAVVLATGARVMVAAPLGREASRALLGTLKWFLTTVVVGSLISRMDLFFVSGFAGVREAGIYSAAQVFALLPGLLGMYMSAVFSPRIMSLWQQGKLKPIYTRYQLGLLALSFGCYIIAILGLKTISASLLPAAFQRSSGVILALLPVGLCTLVDFPWTIPLLLYVRPRLLLAMDCVGVVILAPLYVMVTRRGGALGVAMATSGFMLIRVTIHQWLAWRLLRIGPDISGGTEETLAGRQLSLAGIT